MMMMVVALFYVKVKLGGIVEVSLLFVCPFFFTVVVGEGTDYPFFFDMNLLGKDGNKIKSTRFIVLFNTFVFCISLLYL